MFIDLIKYPIRTEKYVEKELSNGQQTYTFALDVRLTKPQIKKLFEEVFQVHVISVNTAIAPSKKKRLGFYQGSLPRYKRAIITLRAGQKLDLSTPSK